MCVCRRYLLWPPVIVIAVVAVVVGAYAVAAVAGTNELKLSVWRGEGTGTPFGSAYMEVHAYNSVVTSFPASPPEQENREYLKSVVCQRCSALGSSHHNGGAAPTSPVGRPAL